MSAFEERIRALVDAHTGWVVGGDVRDILTAKIINAVLEAQPATCVMRDCGNPAKRGMRWICDSHFEQLVLCDHRVPTVTREQAITAMMTSWRVVEGISYTPTERVMDRMLAALEALGVCRFKGQP